MKDRIIEAFRDIYLTIEMPDGIWAIPVWVIVLDRERSYSDQEGFNLEGDILYLLDNYDRIEDWAENNMDWEDFDNHPFRWKPKVFEPQDYWCRNEKEIYMIVDIKKVWK